MRALFDTEYDRANVPPYNGNDPPPAPGSLKRSLFPTLLNEVQNKGTQGVRARYGAELPPIISIVQYPGHPVISVPELWSDRPNCSHNVSQKVKRIRRISELIPPPFSIFWLRLCAHSAGPACQVGDHKACQHTLTLVRGLLEQVAGGCARGVLWFRQS